MNQLINKSPKAAPHSRSAGMARAPRPSRTARMRRTLENILFVLLLVILFILLAQRSVGKTDPQRSPQEATGRVETSQR